MASLGLAVLVLKYKNLLISSSWRRRRVFLKKESFKLAKTFYDQAGDEKPVPLGGTESRRKFHMFLRNHLRKKMQSLSERSEHLPLLPGMVPFGVPLHRTFPGSAPPCTQEPDDT